VCLYCLPDRLKMSHMKRVFQRESYVRTKSERDLDRLCIQNERDQIRKKREEIDQLNPLLKKQKIEAAHKHMAESKAVPKEVKPEEALTKIRRNITNPKKFSTCCRLLNELLKKKLHQFDHSIVFQTLEYLYSTGMIVDHADAKSHYKGMFDIVQNDEEYLDGFADNQKIILENLFFDANMICMLHTDDTYQLTNGIRDLTKHIEQLPDTDRTIKLADRSQDEVDNVTKADEEEEKKEQTETKQITSPPKSNDEYRRETSFRCINVLNRLTKMSWATSIVSRFLKSVYQSSRSKFTQTQEDTLSQYITSLNRTITKKTKLSQDAKYRDEKTTGIAESYNPIIDARSEVVTTDGMNNWTNKQSGL